MTTISRDDILKLTVSERLELIDTIWDSIRDDADLPLTDAQRREIDRRLDQYEVTPPSLSSWEEARAHRSSGMNVRLTPEAEVDAAGRGRGGRRPAIAKRIVDGMRGAP